jgi:hypothetical protein
VSCAGASTIIVRSSQQAAIRPSAVMRMFLASFINNDYTHRPNFYYSKVNFALSVHFAQNAAAHICIRGQRARGRHGNKDRCHRRAVFACFATYLFAPERPGSCFHSLSCTHPPPPRPTFLRRKSNFSTFQHSPYMKRADGATFSPIASLSIIFTRIFRGYGESFLRSRICRSMRIPPLFTRGSVGARSFSEARKIFHRCALRFIVNNIMWIGFAKCVCAVVIKF